jgi:hypothetical protein
MIQNDWLIELDIQQPPEDISWMGAALSNGKVVVVRNVVELRHFRQQVIEYSSSLSDENFVADELVQFFDNKIEPSLESVWCLTEAVKLVRSTHYLSLLLAPLISRLGFPVPVRVHNALPRLVFSPDTVGEAQRSGIFPEEDFKRVGRGRLTEVFMPGYANIHRDFNRPHSLFMCNVWFTLYDAEPEEVLRVWPQYYHGPYLDMDNSPENIAKLGQSLDISLQQGDLVLFHGEHLHSSPLHGNDQRRFSYDLRIAAHCLNDVRHYRQDFVHLGNLLPVKGRDSMPSLSIMRALLDGSDPVELNIDYVPVLEWPRLHGECNCAELPVKVLAERFSSFPFDEERTLCLLAHAISTDDDLVDKLISEFEFNSSSPFWLLQLVKLMNANGLHEQTDHILRRIVLAATEMAVPNYAPVHYRNGPNESFPDEWVAEATRMLDGLDNGVQAHG